MVFISFCGVLDKRYGMGYKAADNDTDTEYEM